MTHLIKSSATNTSLSALRKSSSYSLTTASTSNALADSASKWAIAKEDGSDALTYTSFLSCDVKNDSQIVNGSIEEGSFAAYNKVHQPIEISVSVGVSGTDSELQEALDKAEALKNGLDLVSIVTPNAEYENMNLVSISYQRSRENGLGALWLDLEFQEVKQVEAQTTNVKLAQRVSTGVKTTDQSMLNAAVSSFAGRSR